MLRFILNLSLIFTIILSINSCTEDTVEPELFGTIDGTVMDAEFNSPLPDVSITTSPATEALVTDGNGKFRITDIPVGEYAVSVTKPGYDKKSVSVSVKSGKTTSAVIMLQPKTDDNSAPLTPSNPSPQDQSTDQPIDLTLSWNAADPDKDDNLIFDVYLYKSNSSEKVVAAADYSDTTLTVGDLDYSETYFWQVIAKDSSDNITNGEVWTFTTRPLPNHPIVFAADWDGDYNIYSAGEDGMDSIRLTSNTARDWYPVLNPSSDKIAFSSNRNVDYHIYTMNKDGSEEKKITTIPVAGFHNNGVGFSWLPDGGGFLYSNYEKIYRINSDGSNLTEIATAPAGRNFREAQMSPDGNKIVALAIGSQPYNSEIYLMNSDGSGQEVLVGNLPGMIERPTFSIDGTKIMFTRDVSGFESPTGRQLDSHIFVMNIDKSDTVDISSRKPAGTNDLNPRFSPDGSYVIFNNQINDASSPADIYVISLEENVNDVYNRTKLINSALFPDWKR